MISVIDQMFSGIEALIHPGKQFVLWHDHPLSDVQRRKALASNQVISASAGDTQHGDDQLGI